jgi:hypothetical protein
MIHNDQNDCIRWLASSRSSIHCYWVSWEWIHFFASCLNFEIDSNSDSWFVKLWFIDSNFIWTFSVETITLVFKKSIEKVWFSFETTCFDFFEKDQSFSKKCEIFVETMSVFEKCEAFFEVIRFLFEFISKMIIEFLNAKFFKSIWKSIYVCVFKSI